MGASRARAEPRAERHGSIAFVDGTGSALVHFGAAFAIDAEGRQTTMTSSFDGDRIRLRLDGEWLKSAAWPIVVDGNGILWIPGFRVDERVKITERTKRALRLEAIGADPSTQERR